GAGVIVVLGLRRTCLDNRDVVAGAIGPAPLNLDGAAGADAVGALHRGFDGNQFDRLAGEHLVALGQNIPDLVAAQGIGGLQFQGVAAGGAAIRPVIGVRRLGLHDGDVVALVVGAAPADFDDGPDA